MKTIVYIGLFLISGSLLAQEKSRDKVEVTETKTITSNNGREVTQEKIKVTTTEEQKIEMSEDDENKVNQERNMDAGKKITQKVEIDNDSDPFYDSSMEVVNYQENGMGYKFVKTTDGFDVTTMESDMEYGQAIKASNSNKYEFKTGEFSGVGYFDDQGNFIVEYVDKNTNQMVTKKFVSPKK